jgi:hypothetical protein
MARVFVFMLALVLAACGGGGSGTPAAALATPPAAAVMSGIAATGGAISGRIYLKDAAGHELSFDTTDGSFSFTLTGLTAPFMLKAQWTTSGVTRTLYSFSASASGGTANITPLTHLAVVGAAGTASLDAVYDAGGASAFAALAAALPAAVAQVRQGLAPLLAKNGASALDPISGVFLPNHLGMDAVLDGISVSYLSGNATVADKTSGALVLEASVADLAHALAVPDWSAQDAALAADPDVALAANGDGLVAWSETIAGHSVVRARFLAGNIAAATTLSSSGESGLPKVAFDGAANAIVVWAQYENGRNDIWARRWSASSKTWAAPLRLSDANAVADANVPDVALDAAGNAIVVWHQGDGRTNHFDAWSATYAATPNAWTAPALLSNGIDSAADPHVALNAGGKGIAAWEQEQGDGTMVSNGPKDAWGRSVATGAAWGASARLNAVGGDVDGLYGQVAVAVDGQGNGFALWVQSSGQLPLVVHAARYGALAGWQASGVITSNAVNSSYGPHIAFDASGNAVAVWQQQTDVSAFVGVARYDAVTGWGASTALGTDVAGAVYDPRIALDGAGNATAVWYQWSDTAIEVMTNRALAGGAWGASRLLSHTPPVGFTYPVPRVAANAAGATLAIWGTDSF